MSSTFDFYGAQNKIDSFKTKEDELVAKLSRIFKRLDAIRVRRRNLERRIEREKYETAEKPCGAVRARTDQDDVVPGPCCLPVGHDAPHHDERGRLWLEASK